MKILLIEDDIAVAHNLAKGLIEKQFKVDICHDGQSGQQAALSNHYELLIVDRMLPKVDGLTVIRNLRKKNYNKPIIVLTALSEVDDTIEGLEAGGDDYLAKPFNFSELLARIKVLLRRTSPEHEPQMQLSFGDLHIDKITREIVREGQSINLQQREYNLLLYFAENENEIVTRDMLLKNIWGLDFNPKTNVVDVHVHRLRKKLDHGFRDPLLKTVRGAGYIFNEH